MGEKKIDYNKFGILFDLCVKKSEAPSAEKTLHGKTLPVTLKLFLAVFQNDA